MEAKNTTYKEYKDLGDSDSHFLIIEVEGELKNAEDLRSLIEKHEVPGLGMSAIANIGDRNFLKFIGANVIK